MNDDAKIDVVSRRGFLGMGSAALAAAGMLSAEAAGQEQSSYPTKNERSASAPGPGNSAMDAQNPDSFLPPQSDAGGVQAFKYPFGLSHKRMQEGGMVARGHRAGAPDLEVDRRRRHAIDGWWHTRTALARGG